MVQLPGFRMNMTEALAHSNNLYFEELGRELGFDRVRHYATQFGLGELAGYNIPGEQLGVYPDEPIPASEGGVGRMCSFGQGVSMTPLQLGALWRPLSPTAERSITCSIRPLPRKLPTSSPRSSGHWISPSTFRTCRTAWPAQSNTEPRAAFAPTSTNFPVFGKTGTCSDNGTRFGWFASYSDTPQGSLVTVFFLEGGRPLSVPAPLS